MKNWRVKNNTTWRYMCLVSLIGIVFGFVYYVDNRFEKLQLIQLPFNGPENRIAQQTNDNLNEKFEAIQVNSYTDIVEEQSLEALYEDTDSIIRAVKKKSQVHSEEREPEQLTDAKPEINKVTDIKQLEQILRDSITNYHLANFIKPQNETCKRRLPICMLVGVAKCGTREIIDFMRLHPHIEIYHGESSYEDPYFARNYDKGTQWFRRQMPCSYSNQITVIKNAWYFHVNGVPERIKRFNESIKLILLVREPVSRAISQATFQGGHTFKFERKFLHGDAVNTEDTSIRHSVYDKQMLKWLQYFKLDQFLIIESSEFEARPADMLKKIEEFLGLGHFITHEMFVFNKEKGFYCIKSNLTLDGMACFGKDRGREHVSVAPSIVSKLKEYFRHKNERFFKIIGRSFDWD